MFVGGTCRSQTDREFEIGNEKDGAPIVPYVIVYKSNIFSPELKPSVFPANKT
jgi:hypothetical protein